MTKSAYAEAVDEIQRALRPVFKDRGFKVKGRTFNRTTEDGLVQVVGLQMGASDPPGTTYFPGLRENLHGLFTVNLGVYVPDVARHHLGGEAKSWVQDYHCCVRARLAEACGEDRDLWWPAQSDDTVLGDVVRRLEVGGFPFLERYATRDKLLNEWSGLSESEHLGGPPRIVMAIILAERGELERARELLSLQALETRNPGHPAYVKELARRLGVDLTDA